MLTLVGDFETTTMNDRNQEETEVWASALVELYTENVVVLNSIADTFYYILSLKQNMVIYYHNLKFDGSFWIDYLYRHQHFKNAYDPGEKEWKKTKELNNNEVKYLISSFGEWYSITFKINGKIIEIRDSLKLIRMSVDDIGAAFNTKHRKLSMNYYGERFAGCYISPEEKEYIKNDVLVVKEALEIFYDENHKKLTIGSCCMQEYNRSLKYDDINYSEYFPNLDYEITPGIIADKFVRLTYRGGWCLVKEGAENTVHRKGATFDNNSLYPFTMMNRDFPTGEPVYIEGKPKVKKRKFYFYHIKAKFFLKENYLPTLLINNNLRYKHGYYAKNSLPCSDFTKNKFTIGNETFDDHMELYLTEVDLRLLEKHYNIIEIEYIDCLEFDTTPGDYLFSGYLQKYQRIKENSTGGTRTVAKLFSNNLGGKFGTSPNASFKVGEIVDDIVKFTTIPAVKQSMYCPVASAMTSYAREITITAAQKNYKDFNYSDTDSMHMNTCNPIGIEIDGKKYGAWKLEQKWTKGLFVRQKTYIEKFYNYNKKKLINFSIPCKLTRRKPTLKMKTYVPDYNICCAGLPEVCKRKFIKQLKSGAKKMTDFKKGLEIFGKLQQKRIKGGVILYEDWFTMK